MKNYSFLFLSILGTLSKQYSNSHSQLLASLKFWRSPYGLTGHSQCIDPSRTEKVVTNKT